MFEIIYTINIYRSYFIRKYFESMKYYWTNKLSKKSYNINFRIFVINIKIWIKIFTENSKTDGNQ